MSEDNENKKLKSVLLTCTTLIAIASLVLNVVQFQENRKVKMYEQISQYPVINHYRLRLSLENYRRINFLIQEGVHFSHIPNPSFVTNEVLDVQNSDESSMIEFLVIANNSTIPLSDISLFSDNTQSSLDISYINKGSTLLTPILKIDQKGEVETINTFKYIEYSFDIGGHRVRQKKDVSQIGHEAVVFEVGLGPITRAKFDFESEFR